VQLAAGRQQDQRQRTLQVQARALRRHPQQGLAAQQGNAARRDRRIRRLDRAHDQADIELAGLVAAFDPIGLADGDVDPQLGYCPLRLLSRCGMSPGRK